MQLVQEYVHLVASFHALCMIPHCCTQGNISAVGTMDQVPYSIVGLVYASTTCKM